MFATINVQTVAVFARNMKSYTGKSYTNCHKCHGNIIVHNTYFSVSQLTASLYVTEIDSTTVKLMKQA